MFLSLWQLLRSKKMKYTHSQKNDIIPLNNHSVLYTSKKQSAFQTQKGPTATLWPERLRMAPLQAKYRWRVTTTMVQVQIVRYFSDFARTGPTRTISNTWPERHNFGCPSPLFPHFPRLNLESLSLLIMKFWFRLQKLFKENIHIHSRLKQPL